MSSDVITSRPSWTLEPLRHMLTGHLPFLRTHREITSAADRSWIIAPEETTEAPNAFYLPGQLERITGQEFNSEPPAELMRAQTKRHMPTRGFLLRNVTLIDGTLYKGDARTFLAPRRNRWLPRITVDTVLRSASLYSTAVGLRYFGSWLIDDCATYALAAGTGAPLTLEAPRSSHATSYETILGMDPLRASSAFIKELIVFHDHSQNSHKGARFRSMVSKVSATVKGEDCPGVFILRGAHGVRRVLTNEFELADTLRKNRGFRVVDPMSSDLPSLLAACKGARVVVGVEGSGLIHGLLTLAEGGSVLTLQPPSRFVSVYKNLTDRDLQHFAFVVGEPVGKNGDFIISGDELERTLDLLPNKD